MTRRYFPKKLIFLLVAFGLVYLLNHLKVFNFFRGLAEASLIIPFKQTLYDRQKKDLAVCQLENERQLSELKVKIAFLEEENASQKRLLSAPLPQNWQFLSAKVIEVANEEIKINQGRNEGLKEGMVAIIENTYLGKVATVSQEMASIRLPSYYENKLAVKIVSADQGVAGQGLLVGRGEGKMRIEQVLASEEISQGDLVVVRIEGEDLLVGSVEEIVELMGEVFKTAKVKRLYQPSELDTIFLIRGKI